VPTFDGGSAVEPMRCKLPQSGFDGDIPEPSHVQVQAFLDAQRSELVRIRKENEGIPDDEDLEATLARINDPEKAAAAHKRSAKIYADVCSGSPSAADLEKLPFRVFAVFTTWLNQVLLNPEAETGAGSSQG
jgi:hypothetical protein